MTEGTSPFEPDVAAPAPSVGEGQPVATPDIRKMGEALRDRIEIRSLFCDHIEALAPVGEFLGR